MKPRLGCVPFLNAKPLVSWFCGDEGLAADVVFENPSALGPMVDRGEVDAAIASSFFAIADPTLTVAAGVSIASNGPVESVRLFSKVPFDRIQSLALDAASMTSNHLAQILLYESYDVQPSTCRRPASLSAMLDESDAAVLIGDAGMAATGEGLHVLDLGEAWTNLTGRPFVWAFWVGRGGLTSDLARELKKAREYGQRNVESISFKAASEHGFSNEVTLHYLDKVIDFDLTTAHLGGFELFGAKCVQMGFVPHFQMPRVVGEASPSGVTS